MARCHRRRASSTATACRRTPSRARATGRAVEALYASPQRAHGAYALGVFTRLFVFLAGEEYDRGLIFVGDQSGYRSGPMRARDLSALRDLASSARTEAPPPSPRARGYHLPARLDGEVS